MDRGIVLRDSWNVNDFVSWRRSATSHSSVHHNVEPGGEDDDAKATAMSEFVKHHVKEEQNEMFPNAKKTRLNKVALGGQTAARKASGGD